MEIFNYMLEIDILRNSSQFFWGILRGALEVFGCPKRHPDALLAKTMPLILDSFCWSKTPEGPLWQGVLTSTLKKFRGDKLIEIQFE